MLDTNSITTFRQDTDISRNQFGHSALSPKLYNTNNRYLQKRFDNREANNMFLRDLKGGGVNHYPTNTKNSIKSIWSTIPARRIDRIPTLKPMHMNHRSGFNKKINDAILMNVIDQPISNEQLNQSTLKF